ncbi:NAD(P)H-binding protein [Streptomyces sp. NPDC057199]|uniref:NAD(P)H-binding protein n=1 Tax=Streptomyces sp. NPDC057199 TaxID=3346047 RepID=UPI00362CF380
MSQNQNITDVLMIGATGSIGQLALRAAQRQGLHPRALVRDPRRAEQLLPGVELVKGDLEAPASLRRLVLEQGDTADGRIARDQIAETLVRSLLTDTALGKTFELIATEGDEPSDWAELFGALKSAESGSMDGVLDPADLPVEAEPRRVLADLEAVRSVRGTSETTGTTG